MSLRLELGNSGFKFFDGFTLLVYLLSKPFQFYRSLVCFLKCALAGSFGVDARQHHSADLGETFVFSIG